MKVLSIFSAVFLLSSFNCLAQVDTFDLWTKIIPKDSIIATMEDQQVPSEDIDSITIYMPSMVDYIIVNNKGFLEQYLQVNTDKYLRVSRDSIEAETGGNAEFVISESNLYLNDVLLSGFTKSEKTGTSLDMDLSSRSILLRLCCKACYAVHDRLDIRILDCLCCLLKCKPCFPVPFILSFVDH